MVKQANIVKEFFKYIKYIKNNKGQGLVDFAVVVFFCVVIGLAARESGLIDALADTYSDKVQIALGPSGISMSEANASGNQSTGNTSGDGTSGIPVSGTGSGTGTGDGTGTGSGTGTGDGTGTGSGTGTGDGTGTGSGTGTGDGTGTGSGTGSGSGTGTGSGTGSEGGSGSTPGIPAGGSTGGNSIVILASTPAGASTILLKYADYAKDHNLQQWQAVDPAWAAYQADGSPLGITSKDTFANVIIYNWQAANASWTSWNDISGSDWQWSEIKRYYETWKKNNS